MTTRRTSEVQIWSCPGGTCPDFATQHERRPASCPYCGNVVNDVTAVRKKQR